MVKYILLARHGPTEKDLRLPDREQKLKSKGKSITEVGAALAEWLTLQPEDAPIKIGEIRNGTYKQVRETRDILHKALEESECVLPYLLPRPDCRLNPDQFFRSNVSGKSTQVIRQERRAIATELERELKELQDGANAILVVGHAPHLSWIAEGILHSPPPMTRSEIQCLAIGDEDENLRRWPRPIQWVWRSSPGCIQRRVRDWPQPIRWLAWTVAPTDDQSTRLLREKIRSKMDLAKTLGGVITGTLAILLGVGLNSEKFGGLPLEVKWDVALSIVCFLLALGLYLATMYAYDRLLMPDRFWAETSDIQERRWLVRRPPSSLTWILYQNMMRIWDRMFTPATWLVVLGLFFLAFAALQLNPLDIILMTPLLVLFRFYYDYFQPVLGTRD